MKKALYLIQLAALAVLFSSATFADDDWGGRGHHGWGHHGHHHGGHHHGHHGWGRPQVNNYYPQPPQVNNYYPQPQANYYYQQPQQYYPPQPQYQGGYDNRSHQGLAGGVVGTVFGYELGNGHPLAAGLGAAAGSFLGNGMGWRY
ncbi:MAG: hypothetical protein HOP36_03825 [Methyloglobulus sp.]|nr:hypothetical protein [Methyloglobulus sp.]